MKKYFLVLLLSATTFCAYSQVILPDNVARFYLEKKDEADMLRLQVIDLDKTLFLYTQMIVEKDKIISTYLKDKESYEGLIKTKNEMVKLKEEELTLAKKEISKQKRQKVFIVAGGVIMALLLL